MIRRISGSNVEVRPAHSGGMGIFASTAFRRGDAIHTVEYDREITAEHPLRPEIGERAEHCTYLDGKVMLVAHPGRYMNHSCDPNAFYRYRGSTAEACARRAIAIGEEISVDYLINNPGGDSWPCNCGSSRCRGCTGTSFFDLPAAFQREYFPLLAPWFKQRFPHEVARLASQL